MTIYYGTDIDRPAWFVASAIVSKNASPVLESTTSSAWIRMKQNRRNALPSSAVCALSTTAVVVITQQANPAGSFSAAVFSIVRSVKNASNGTPRRSLGTKSLNFAPWTITSPEVLSIFHAVTAIRHPQAAANEKSSNRRWRPSVRGVDHSGEWADQHCASSLEIRSLSNFLKTAIERLSKERIQLCERK